MTKTEMTKVVAVPTTVEYGGKKYGPFRASEGKPFTEVPTVIAQGLGLPVYAGQEVTPEAGSGGTVDPATQTASTQEGEADEDSSKGGQNAPTLRTGDLPGNFVGVGKLKAGDVTTFEALREKDAAALVELGLTEEQAQAALAKANDPLGPAKA